MRISLFFFDSTVDFVRYVDQQLTESKELLLSHMRKLDETRRKFDIIRVSQDVDKSKVLKSGLSESTKQTEIEGFKVLFNPAPEYELNLLDEAIKAIQEKLEALEKTKKRIIPTLQNSARIIAIFDDGIPTAFMYYKESSINEWHSS